MGLNSSLNMAISGMRSTQVGLNVVSQNVANADTPGYVRRSISTIESQGGYTTSSNVQRLLDRIVQHQLWQESSAAAYTSTRADVMSKVDELYGAPGSATALDSVYNAFTSTLQALKDDPSNYTTRTAVLDRANELANRLNGLSTGVQDLRRQAEAGIANGVEQINGLLNSLTSVNAKIVGSPDSPQTAALRDQRDKIVAELSQYMDIRTSEDSRGSLSIITPSGTQLFDGKPAVTFSFDEHQNLGPGSQWSADPAQRGVGTITMRNGSGAPVDAIASKVFRSGEIAANIELRDKTLVQAQAQLDEIAAQMSSALSDREVKGTAITAGAATGFDVDLSDLQAGNTVTLDYKIQPSGETRRFTFVKVDSPASLPLPASASGDANNTVVGIDFSGDVAAQIQAAVGPGFTVANTGTGVSIVDDDSGGNIRDVLGLTARPTVTGLTDGEPELPFFVDGAGNAAYTGSYEGGAQSVGFAGRIKVNPGLIADRSKLVVYDAGIPQGDTTRAGQLLDRLTLSERNFTRASGLDGSTATSTGTIKNFVQRVVASTGQAVEAAQRLDEGQQVALASVQSRFQEQAQVNVDEEMSTLIQLQAAYAANARIITTVKEMMDLLMRV